ncbi:neutral amino acid permease [Moniliophthora roreri MCA 2997]|uniref:Neutral amino acid permease n=2 Tax=Moniliophthora roreri TaxID=221103 RepID=V2X880_MONRO|nr:neutral amino acid permease [Moniliophthora roreri MCA 2997]KAI3602259.1 neutral amino acid permease [Moniliophthora roreri]
MLNSEISDEKGGSHSEEHSLEDQEVFKKTKDGVDFRTVGWPRAALVFLKVLFATGVLSIPTAMVSLGAVGGALSLVGWGLLNTYTAVILGDFRNNHPGCHTIVDMAYIIGGPLLREFVGVVYIAAYVLCAGAGILGVSVALNALSSHATCTVWFSLVSTVFVIGAASIRKFHDLAWLTWVGTLSVFVAVMVVVVAVTQVDRPAAAPQTGPFELGFYAFPPSSMATFGAGMSATCAIFISSAGTSAFIPVIAEMRKPGDYRKALYVATGSVTSVYVAVSLVVYHWCGMWVASPSLGSAGPVIKKVAYGIGLIGLVVSGCLYLHVAAKYLFVRILRNSRHLQVNTVVHWGTWLGCTIILGSIAFILASAIPIFNYLISLTGSLCFAPLALILPGLLWIHDHGRTKGIGLLMLHGLLILLGAFICVGGTYGVVVQIIQAYRNKIIGGAFECADNSNSVAH